MKIISSNGTTAAVFEIRSEDEDDALLGYTVAVNGESVGNRIVRTVGDTVTFTSIARNERVIAERETLHEAVADVLNDGMRDRQRR